MVYATWKQVLARPHADGHNFGTHYWTYFKLGHHRNGLGMRFTTIAEFWKPYRDQKYYEESKVVSMLV